MLLSSAAAPFVDPEWTYELKWDGFRAIVVVDPRASVRLYSRNGTNMTRWFPELQDIRHNFVQKVILDAEICALDDDGSPCFDAIRRTDWRRAVVAFDLLRVGRRQLLHAPLDVRSGLLSEIIPLDTEHLIRSKSVSDGLGLYALAEQCGLEGIVAKRKRSTYVPGVRTTNWKKIKTPTGKEVTRRRMRFALLP